MGAYPSKLIDICNIRKIKEDETIALKTIENKKKNWKFSLVIVLKIKQKVQRPTC